MITSGMSIPIPTSAPLCPKAAIVPMRKFLFVLFTSLLFLLLVSHVGHSCRVTAVYHRELVTRQG